MTPPILKLAITANTTVVIPAGMYIESIAIEGYSDVSITGGLKIGTTDGGTDVVSAQEVVGNVLIGLADTVILKRLFSMSANQTLYIQAVTAWVTGGINMYIIVTKLIK